MTPALGLTATCLVAACLAGCAVGDSNTADTLPAMIGSPAQPVRDTSLTESVQPILAPTVPIADRAVGGLGRYPTMLWLLTASGVLDEIGSRPVTIFAPSETAFRDFAFLDGYGLMANPTAMAPTLRGHVVLGVYDIDDLVAAGSVTNLAGERLTVWPNGRRVMVDEAVLTPPADADGGDDAQAIVYGIDRLLLLAKGTP